MAPDPQHWFFDMKISADIKIFLLERATSFIKIRILNPGLKALPSGLTLSKKTLFSLQSAAPLLTSLAREKIYLTTFLAFIKGKYWIPQIHC